MDGERAVKKAAGIRRDDFLTYRLLHFLVVRVKVEDVADHLAEALVGIVLEVGDNADQLADTEGVRDDALGPGDVHERATHRIASSKRHPKGTKENVRRADEHGRNGSNMLSKLPYDSFRSSAKASTSLRRIRGSTDGPYCASIESSDSMVGLLTAWHAKTSPIEP